MGKVNTAFDHIDNKDKVKELSVVLYTDSFFYGFWDSEDILVRSGSEHRRSLLSFIADASDTYNLSITRVMSTLKPYTHLPSADYRKDLFRDYFKGLYPMRKVRGKKKTVDNFVSEDIKTLYFVDKALKKKSKKIEGKVRHGHISTAMANYAFLVEKDVIGYVSDETLHIACAHDNKFQFYNQFKCYHKEDFLYFFLLVFHGLDLDPAEETVLLGGGIDVSSPLFRTLNGYIPGIEIREDNLQMDSVFPKQYYFDLYLCKSCV